jgi:polygalacturonase
MSLTKVSYSMIDGAVVNVLDYGADPTGAADSTSAIQAAINSFASGRGTVWFPIGTFKVTSTITVTQNRIHLVGAGSWATQILFVPTANDTCIELSNGAAVLYQGSVVGMSFYSEDSTYAKTALEISDVSGYNIEDIVVGGNVVSGGSTFWSGGTGSRGLWIKGREATYINRVFVYADKPIEISTNPNNSISIDHFHFANCYLGANGFPCVTINSNVNLTNVTFDGYQLWVLGTYGLYWVDTATVGVSQTLTLANVRTEQGTSSTAYSVYISHNSALQSLKIENSQLDTTRNGIYLRKVDRASIYNVIDTSTAGTHTILDADSTVREIDIRNCYWNTGAIASLTGQNVVLSTQGPVSAALPSTALYTSVTNPMTVTAAANSGYELTLTDTSVASLGPNTTAGMLTIVDSEYFSAIFNLRGTHAVVSEVSDPVGVYSASSGTASSTNVYWSAGNSSYEIQNLRGATRKYKIVLNGTYSSF